MFWGRARYSVRTTRFESGERFSLLYDGQDGLPLPWTTRYSAIFRRSKEGSVSTMVQELRAIAIALNWADETGLDIEGRIGTATFLLPEEVLSLRDALRVNLKADADDPIDPTIHYSRCVYVRDYIRWRGQHVVQRIPNGDPRFLPARVRLDEFTEGMTALLPKLRTKGREGLAPAVETRLREVIEPDHPENPFRRGQRHRNYALLLCYLDLGIRLSEALVIKGADLRLDGPDPTVTIHRRPDDRDDTRLHQPLTKTAARILPLGENLRAALMDWVLKHRTDKTRYPGSKRTPYVFVARNGRPIAARTVHDLFVQMRTVVAGLPPKLSAHLARHTWNDNFSRHADNKGMEEEEEKRLRNYLMGWSKVSAQAATYTKRHTEETASKHSLSLQKKSHRGKNK